MKINEDLGPQHLYRGFGDDSPKLQSEVIVIPGNPEQMGKCHQTTIPLQWVCPKGGCPKMASIKTTIYYIQ